MARLQFTTHESGWIRLLGTLTLLITGFYFAQPLLPTTHEPLADRVSLTLLAEGLTIGEPTHETRGEFHGQEVTPLPLASISEPSSVLGVGSSDKRIEVDLTNQKVYAFEGERRIYEFTVSTGKWAPTPTGEFTIWSKVRSQKMSGGSKALRTYYYLPNVPYVMFFYNNDIAKMRGFSLHGTYWHDNFGHPMSHGCINMRIPDAQVLYEWVDPPITDPKAWSTLVTNHNSGTKVVIYGVTPRE